MPGQITTNLPTLSMGVKDAAGCTDTGSCVTFVAQEFLVALAIIFLIFFY